MSRKIILGRVRTALGCPRPGDAARQRAVSDMLASPRRNTIPARAEGSRSELVKDFVRRLSEHLATVIILPEATRIPGVIRSHLAAAEFPLRVRMGSDPRLSRLAWSSVPDLVCLHGAAEHGDRATLSHAMAGVSETGTLVLASGTDNPVTLSFLPETHFVVVREKDIAGSLEESFDAVRRTFGNGTMPRTLNLISAPSRTGDIGGRLVMGAHGPRQLVVLIVQEVGKNHHDGD